MGHIRKNEVVTNECSQAYPEQKMTLLSKIKSLQVQRKQESGIINRQKTTIARGNENAHVHEKNSTKYKKHVRKCDQTPTEQRVLSEKLHRTIVVANMQNVGTLGKAVRIIRVQFQHTDGGKWRGPRNPPRGRHFRALASVHRIHARVVERKPQKTRPEVTPTNVLTILPRKKRKLSNARRCARHAS